VTLTPAGLARLVDAALPGEALTADDLDTCCFGPHSEVVGDDQAAVVLHVRHWTEDFAIAWIVLVAVHPDARRQGRGRSLVEEAVALARGHGAREVQLGAAVPRYVWPGVDFRFTAALALFEACGFEPTGAEINMAIPTGFRADAPAGVTVEREQSDDAVGLARRHWPHWEDEVARAVEHGSGFVARASGSAVAFGCHSVNRHSWIGPMATDPGAQRGGIGRAVLSAVCEDLQAAGFADADIAWVGPVGFYAKCGARVSRVFRTGRLVLGSEESA
jgi:GNAT superfamily N-acetyltransferase